MARYYIPNHVFFVSEGHSVVFLDPRRDQYSLLLGDKARAFQVLLPATVGSLQELQVADSATRDATQSLVQELLSELASNHLLTTERFESATKSDDISLPDEDLLQMEDAPVTTTTLLDLLRFLVSCTKARWRLKFQSIEDTVRLLKSRKDNRDRHLTPSAESELRRLTHVFRKLRPLFPMDFLCLFDSMSLMEFLAQYGFYPDMIFAVKLDPWSAHCWLQYGTLALNQDFDEARAYRPIMAV